MNKRGLTLFTIFFTFCMMVFFSVDAQAAVKLSKKKIVLEKGTKYELSLYDSAEEPLYRRTGIPKRRKALNAVLVFININLRLWQHRLHHIEVLLPVVRRYKSVRFPITLQPNLSDAIDISFL